MSDTLAGGITRFATPTIAFLFERLRPGVLLTAIRGRDRGELGSAPLDYVAREYARFGKPVEWHIDASAVVSAANAVAEQWSAWLGANAAALAHIHILTGAGATNLTVNVARHFSGLSSKMTVHQNRDLWLRAAGDVPDLAARFDEPAVPIARESAPGGGARLTTPDCSWTFIPLTAGHLYSEFTGSDKGDLTDAAMDAVESAMARTPGKLHWYLDLRNAGHVAPSASRAWTEWLAARRDKLSGITALSPSALFPLVLTVASFGAGIESLLTIHRDEETFRAALPAAAATPGCG